VINPSDPGLLVLPELVLQGPWQMAIDHWLLRAVDAGELGPVLRFYRWPWPCLSLGCHQRSYPNTWNTMACHGDLELVWRPSGGSGVLHGSGLTYALVLPITMVPGRTGVERYRFCCQWLQKAFEQLGHPLVFGQDHGVARGVARTHHCFGDASAADLVDVQGGSKRIGNAQRRSRRALLQHGEILLNPPPLLWQQVFCQPAPRIFPLLPSDVHGLQQRLRQALMEQLGLNHWQPWVPSPGEWTAMGTQQWVVKP